MHFDYLLKKSTLVQFSSVSLFSYHDKKHNIHKEIEHQLTNTKCLVWGSRPKGQEGQRWSTPINKVILLNLKIYQSNTEYHTIINLSLHRVPKDVGSMNKISTSIPILSLSISLKEGAASNDTIFPSLPWSSLSVGTRDHFHENAFGKTHVAHSANMTKPGQLCFSDASKDPLGFICRRKFLKGHLHYHDYVSYPSRWC